jgi:DNA-binding NarL/FixJ family response regulator
LRKHDVVVVIPDARLRRQTTRLFERAGYPTSDAATGEAALAVTRNQSAALIVLDLDLPDMSGYEVCHELREDLGNGPIIVLLSESPTEPADRIAGLLIGADEYLEKPFDPDELLARSRRMLSRSLPLPATHDTPLTGRETQVLQLLAEGSAQDAIAKELFISPKTVATHIQRIITKLGVHSRTEAVALAFRDGLIPEPRRSFP